MLKNISEQFRASKKTPFRQKGIVFCVFTTRKQRTVRTGTPTHTRGCVLVPFFVFLPHFEFKMSADQQIALLGAEIAQREEQLREEIAQRDEQLREEIEERLRKRLQDRKRKKMMKRNNIVRLSLFFPLLFTLLFF